jgi:hypothetical protein
MRQNAPDFRVLALVLGVAFYGCTAESNPPDNGGGQTGGETGSGGSTGSGGAKSSGGSTGSGGASNGGSSGSGSGGASSGGASGSGGASSGGSGGASSGGASGSGGSTSDGPAGTDGAGTGKDAAAADSGKTSGDGGTAAKHPLQPDNPMIACKTTAKYRLPGISPEDFCDFYEAYCPYDPGMPPMRLIDGTNALYASYADCIMRYSMASEAAKTCRAGQLCGTNYKAGQGCTHASGHFDTCK